MKDRQIERTMDRDSDRDRVNAFRLPRGGGGRERDGERGGDRQRDRESQGQSSPNTFRPSRGDGGGGG